MPKLDTATGKWNSLRRSYIQSSTNILLTPIATCGCFLTLPSRTLLAYAEDRVLDQAPKTHVTRSFHLERLSEYFPPLFHVPLPPICTSRTSPKTLGQKAPNKSFCIPATKYQLRIKRRVSSLLRQAARDLALMLQERNKLTRNQRFGVSAAIRSHSKNTMESESDCKLSLWP